MLISDLSQPASLEGLRELSLSDHPIRDIMPLASLKARMSTSHPLST
ncbi:MAG: hypothetical protein IJC98_02815 [Clostridia bacterium]|nr:hypothetical protein [Clostridia bacterium]